MMLSDANGLHLIFALENSGTKKPTAGTPSALYAGKELMIADGRCLNLDEIAWYAKNSEGNTHEMGGKLPNAWGLHDMLGNVWEWCADAWDEKAYGL